MTQPSFATHEVFNQSPPFEDVDLFGLDQTLKEESATDEKLTKLVMSDVYPNAGNGQEDAEQE